MRLSIRALVLTFVVGCGSSDGANVDCSLAPLTGAPSITVETAAMPFPTTAAGGTIASGTYFATHETVYTGGSPDGRSMAVFVFDADAGTFKETQNDRPGVAGTFETSGSTLMLALGCGGNGQVSVGYSATATTVTTFDAQHSRVDTFTKQ